LGFATRQQRRLAHYQLSGIVKEIPMKTRVFLLVLLLMLSSLALAAYDRRLAELKAQIKDDQKLSETDRSTLTKTFEEYLLERNKAFGEMLTVLGNTSLDKQTDNFRNRVDALSREVARRNSDMTKLPLPAYNWYQSFLFDESFFLERLKKSTLPENRDALTKYKYDLGVYNVGLEVEWQGLLSKDQTYDDQEKAIARDLRETLEGVIKQVAEDRKETIETVVSVVTKIPVPGGEVIASVLGKVFKKAATTLTAKMQYVQKRIKEYRDLVSYEENGIYVLFGSTYRTTKEFIEKNSYSKAKVDFEKARDELRSIYEAGTPAQRDDAKEFADQGLKILSDRLAEMEKTFNEFVQKHSGKFFGPVGPDLEEALVETRSWEREADDMKRLDLEGKLREWRDEENKTFISIDFSKISEGQRDAIKTEIKRNLGVLLDAINEADPVFKNESWTINYDRKEMARRLLDRAR
jgi:hypothetical protein